MSPVVKLFHSHSGNHPKKVGPDHRTLLPSHAIQILVSPYSAERLPGRARLGRALRHFSAEFPASRPVNARRAVPPSGSQAITISHSGATLCLRRAFFFSPALILFLHPAALGAQDSATGAIRGTVLDSTGSRIPQASIVVVNTATGMRYAATSDAEGSFTLDLLPPGDYSARAVAQGMSPQVTPQLHVDVGGAAALEFRLTVAGIQENVTVSAAPALVETQPSAVSTLLDERALNDFPLNGRRFSDLALFSPGVTQDPRSLTSSTNGDLSFGGIRGFQNTSLVDGVDYNNAFFAQPRGRDRAPYVISTEVVQEFRVSTNSYGAEQGRSGGAVVNVVTKSGSNHLHGTAFYQLCATVPSARPILSCFQAAQPPAAVRRHRRRPAQTQ